MIALYTSHWRSPILADVDAQIVSISRGQPRWKLPFSYRRLDALAPDDRTWALEDRESFEASYLGQLEALGADRVLGDLDRVAGNRPTIMLCWERLEDPDEYCHRLTLAGFLGREAGIVVPELGPGDLPQREDVVERRLF